jgi:hypothetical protein
MKASFLNRSKTPLSDFQSAIVCIIVCTVIIAGGGVFLPFEKSQLISRSDHFTRSLAFDPQERGRYA